MRANKAVKKVMIDAINNIRPNGTSNWEKGFQRAFKTLKESHENKQTADCEKAIVLFSDETGQAVTVSELFFFKLQCNASYCRYLWTFLQRARESVCICWREKHHF